MSKGIWKNEEVKDLFQSVENAKKKNLALKFAFIEHAQKYSRQPNSVRNYYYHEVDNLWKDQSRKKDLGINLNNHKKSSIKYFSEEQEAQLMQNIKELVENGYSVRKACFTLANGDVGEMLRYQNKYRNFISKQSLQKSNIIKFTTKKKESLSESDLNSLFLGLVRLVKRTATEEMNEKFKIEKENSNALLRKAIADLGKKEKEFSELKSNFLKLKKENASLMQLVEKNSTDKRKKLNDKLSKSSRQLQQEESRG